MNSLLVALILFLIIFAILITVHQIGLDVSINHLYRMPFLSKKYLTTNEKSIYDNTFTSIKLSKYINLDFKYISQDLPSLFIFNPTLFERRSLALSNLKSNIFQIHSDAFSVRPHQIKNRLLYHYKNIVNELQLKRVHIYMLCSSVDTGSYIASHSKDITKSVIVDIPYDNIDNVYDSLLKFEWIKYFLIKPTEFPDPVHLDMKILCLTYDKEKHIDLKSTLTKMSKISSKINLKVFYDIDIIDHAVTYKSKHFIPTIQKWIDKF